MAAEPDKLSWYKNPKIIIPLFIIFAALIGLIVAFILSNQSQENRQKAVVSSCSQAPVNVQFRKFTGQDTPWVNSASLAPLRAGDKIDVNCFALNGSAALKDSQITAILPDRSTKVISAEHTISGYAFTQAGSYTITCTSRTLLGCSDAETFTVLPPLATPTPSPTATPSATPNLLNDNNNCGAIGAVCPSGKTCQSGVCTTISPACGKTTIGTCTGTNDAWCSFTSDGNVNRCFPKDQGSHVNCISSQKSSDVLLRINQLCGQQAATPNLLNDNNNCGAVGVICPSGKSCSNGVCSVPTSSPTITPTPQVSSSPASLAAPSKPTVTVTCSGSTANATISWTGSADPINGFTVDISDSTAFTSYFNKKVGNVSSTNSTGFNGIVPLQNTPLVLTNGVSYYARVFNGKNSQISDVFNIACGSSQAAATSTPTATPVATTIAVTATTSTRVSYPSTASGTLVSGNSTPTILLSLFGMFVLLIGMAIIIA
jgi:hypothetical protein